MVLRGGAAAETTSVLCATGPYTIVGARINSEQLGRRLWIP